MVCSSCSAPNPDDAVACNACGAAWTSPKTVESVFTDPGVFTEAQAPGAKIGARYEISELLGRGGMGLVYKARDLELAEDIAIKVLQTPYTQDPHDVERLKRE